MCSRNLKNKSTWNLTYFRKKKLFFYFTRSVKNTFSSIYCFRYLIIKKMEIVRENAIEDPSPSPNCFTSSHFVFINEIIAYENLLFIWDKMTKLN